MPAIEIWGVAGYLPEGFLTACSFDYLDTSPSNYWFIFIYAVVIFYVKVVISYFLNHSHPQAAYFLPLVIIAYCYFHILHVVVSAKKIQSSKEKNKTELRLAGIVMGIIGLVCLILLKDHIHEYNIYSVNSASLKSFKRFFKNLLAFLRFRWNFFAWRNYCSLIKS